MYILLLLLLSHFSCFQLCRGHFGNVCYICCKITSPVCHLFEELVHGGIFLFSEALSLMLCQPFIHSLIKYLLLTVLDTTESIKIIDTSTMMEPVF